MTSTATDQSIAQLTVRRTIAATPEELFDAFLDAESLAEFMRPGSARHSEVTTDARVGGAFTITMYVDSGVVEHTGHYRQIDRPHTLRFTWVSKNTDHQESVVTVRFVPVPGATTKTDVVLSQVLLPESQVKGHTGGWTRILEILDETFEARRSHSA